MTLRTERSAWGVLGQMLIILWLSRFIWILIKPDTSQLNYQRIWLQQEGVSTEETKTMEKHHEGRKEGRRKGKKEGHWKGEKIKMCEWVLLLQRNVSLLCKSLVQLWQAVEGDRLTGMKTWPLAIFFSLSLLSRSLSPLFSFSFSWKQWETVNSKEIIS